MAAVAAIAVLMAIWWMSEAIPLAATALIPLIAFPLLGVSSSVGAVGKSYGTGTIFLFMGGFFLALAMQRWNLQRRIALRIVLMVGTKPKMLVLGFMIATGFLSMWVSNTATAVMMLPIGISILALVGSVVGETKDIGTGDTKKKSNFGTALMLGIAYSASIASLSTLIGTPPNATLKKELASTTDSLDFATWMLFATPLAWVFLLIAWWLIVNVFYKPEIDDIPGGKELIRKELDKMGKMSAQEKTVAVIFVLAALAWIILPTVKTIIEPNKEQYKALYDVVSLFSDEAIAMILALVLFIVPAKPFTGIKILDWKTAKEVPWDVLLLFGGGFALSDAFKSSGFSLWIGDKSKALDGIAPILMIALFALLIIFLTEVTSNTATAATFVPLVAAISTGMGMSPGALAIPVALAATCAFMLPVATPPNAIAYGSGCIDIKSMVKAGLWLNLIGVVLISIFVYFLAPVVLGVSFS
ncbi:MAG: DASS family sodium-coupled anion symporter [Actinomycetaceae bacterium]|nr:DASS family sodium-coupled anion symporter [Actinomycetaceae bacterium]